MDALFALGVFAVLVIVGYVVGSSTERSHYASIRAREKKLHEVGYPVVTFKRIPPDWRVESGVLVTGSVVVALDYFKRLVAGLRAIVGGRLTSYESLLDRGRREALLRMQGEALARGCNAIVNVRIETSQIGGEPGQRRGGPDGIEVLAFGTGLRLVRGE